MPENTLCNASESRGYGEAEYAAARSFAYKLFAAAFEYPDEARLALLQQGVPAAELRSVISEIAPDLALRTDWDALSWTDEGEELQVEYTRLFDAGVSGPACSLHEGAHRQSRMGALEELVRFYSYFGVARAEEPNDLPDHLSTQLEFLHFLSHGEAVLCQDGLDPADYRRAQRDFLIHHLSKWLPKLAAKLAAADATNFYIELTGLLLAFLNRDIQHSISQVGRGKQDLGIALTTIDEQPTKWMQESEFDESI
jgi:DMSO reductase family type II enzyme chaperone